MIKSDSKLQYFRSGFTYDFLVKFLVEQNFEILVSMIRKWTNGKIIAGLFNRISLF